MVAAPPGAAAYSPWRTVSTIMFPRTNRFLASFGAEVELLRPHLSEVALKRGEVLIERGDEIRFVYFLHNGIVSKLTPFADGGEVEAALVGPEGAVGAAVAMGLRCSLTRDVCHVEARASRVPADRLRQVCAASPVIRDAVQRYVVWKLSSAIRSGACNARHSIGQRLCRWLLTCSDVLESRHIALSQEVFGKMLGVQRTSINPILQDLKAQGAIDIARSRISLRDPAVLLARSCECYLAMKDDQALLLGRRIGVAA
jgi:CRP-like cAMP-binding protein